MKLSHLGIEIDIDPRQATVENRILRMLYKHRHGVRQTKLFTLTSSGRLGADVFNRAVERLVSEANAVTRVTTNHERSFLLKLTPWGESLAESLESTIAIPKPAVEKPLQPEAA